MLDMSALDPSNRQVQSFLSLMFAASCNKRIIICLRPVLADLFLRYYR